jgi:hypothetical protein
MSPRAPWWLRGLSALALALAPALPAAAADPAPAGLPASGAASGAAPAPAPVLAPDDPVNVAAQQRLREIDPPWYDANHDTWRRVATPPKAAPPPASTTAARPPLDLEPLFVIAVCALVAVVIGIMVATFMRTRLPDTLPEIEIEHRRPAESNVAVLDFVPAAGASDPDAALRAALAAHDWRAATIWLYALMLLGLERAGVVRLEAGKTDRAYLREAARGLAERARRTTAGNLARAPGRAGIDALETAVVAFSAVYFGHQPATAESVAEVQRARAALATQLGTK